MATLSSVAGALLGYAIGAFFYDSIGAPVLEALGKGAKMEAFNARFNEYGVWAVLVAGLTPFPFKVITIMSGWTGMPMVPFILSAIVARAARFFIVAGLLFAFGAPIRDFIERRLGLVFTLFCVALIGGFMLLRVL